MKHKVKDNLAIIVGVSVPLLLVLLFAVAAKLPGFFVDPPKYDCLFDQRYVFTVRDGKLHVSYNESKRNNASQQPRLYRYYAAEKNVRELPLDLDTARKAADESGSGQAVLVKSAQDLKLDSATVAPDGYSFQNGSRRRGSFMGLFYSRSYSYNLALTKEGAEVEIPLDRYSYGGYFLGWVAPEEGK